MNNFKCLKQTQGLRGSSSKFDHSKEFSTSDDLEE